MKPIDNIDLVLIVLALLVLGAHFAYSRWKKFREAEKNFRLKNNQPLVWSETSSEAESKNK
ncbi:hypothetical protein ACI0X9_003265 [Cronobacter turicensis]